MRSAVKAVVAALVLTTIGNGPWPFSQTSTTGRPLRSSMPTVVPAVGLLTRGLLGVAGVCDRPDADTGTTATMAAEVTTIFQ